MLLSLLLYRSIYIINPCYLIVVHPIIPDHWPNKVRSLLQIANITTKECCCKSPSNLIHPWEFIFDISYMILVTHTFFSFDVEKNMLMLLIFLPSFPGIHPFSIIDNDPRITSLSLYTDKIVFILWSHSEEYHVGHCICKNSASCGQRDVNHVQITLSVLSVIAAHNQKMMIKSNEIDNLIVIVAVPYPPD